MCAIGTMGGLGIKAMRLRCQLTNVVVVGDHELTADVLRLGGRHLGVLPADRVIVVGVEGIGGGAKELFRPSTVEILIIAWHIVVSEKART